MLPLQPCSPSTATMGQMLGPDRAMDPLQGRGMAGPKGAWCTGLVAGPEETHHCLDRASTQQEQVPHGGSSEGLLVGYFFNIF